MKRIMTFLIAAAMLLTMISCSDNVYMPDIFGIGEEKKTETTEETSDEPEETTAKPEKTTVLSEETTAEPEETTVKEETTAQEEETTAQEEETTAEPEETTAKEEETTVPHEETTGGPVEPKSYDIIGKNFDQTYLNLYFNNQITFNDKWTLKTDAEIREYNMQTLGLASKDYDKAIRNADYFYDMTAQAADGQFNVNIVIQKMSEAPENARPTEKKIVSASIDMMKAAYENAGYTNVVCKQKKITFCGKEHDGVSLKAKLGGADFYLEELVLIEGDYYESVIVGCFEENITDNIFGLFDRIY